MDRSDLTGGPVGIVSGIKSPRSGTVFRILPGVFFTEGPAQEP